MSRVTPRELPRTLSPAQPQAVHPHRHSHTRSTRSATPSASRTCPRALLFRATATAVQAETDVGDARERSSPAHPSREAPGQPTVTSSDRLVRHPRLVFLRSHPLLALLDCASLASCPCPCPLIACILRRSARRHLLTHRGELPVRFTLALAGLTRPGLPSTPC